MLLFSLTNFQKNKSRNTEKYIDDMYKFFRIVIKKETVTVDKPPSFKFYDTKNCKLRDI